MEEGAGEGKAAGHLKACITALPFTYLDVQLEFANGASQLDARVMKTVMVHALTAIHGQVGAAIQLDVLRYNPTSLRTLLRVPSEVAVKVRSALTLLGDYDGVALRFVVHASSPFAHAMAGTSRSASWAAHVQAALTDP